MTNEKREEVDNSNQKKEKESGNKLFTTLILTVFILFWIIFNFFTSVILTLIIILAFTKIEKENKQINKFIPAAIAISVVLILFAIFYPAIQGDREFRKERDEIVAGDSQEFNYLTDNGTFDREIELKTMEIIGYENNSEEQKIRDIEVENGLVYLEFIGNENLKASMTKRGIHGEIRDLLKELPEAHSNITEINIEVWLSLVDERGNEEMTNVMTVTAHQDDWESINWDNFITENIPNVVDNYWVHPALQE
ncbi:MAG: hypothetical protein ACOCRX_10515 [Candidatus Woesearchaeota archaeon]